MKKIIVLMTISFWVGGCKVGNDQPIGQDRLPAAAREFVSRHFSEAEILLATMDKETFDTTYDVFFKDGRKIEFGKNGQWREIDCKSSPIPQRAIPEEIGRYVSSNYPDHFACEIDRDKRGCEVKLNNGIELKFDSRFRLVGVDD